MALRALRSNRLKVGISQHEPFAAGLFKLHLHPGVLALAFDHDHGAKAKLFMVNRGAKAQRGGGGGRNLRDGVRVVARQKPPQVQRVLNDSVRPPYPWGRHHLHFPHAIATSSRQHMCI